MNTTTYLMRNVSVSFSTVLLGDGENETQVNCKLPDSADWSAINKAVHLAAGSFLATLPQENLADVREPGDEIMIQVELEYAELPDGGSSCSTTNIGMTDIESVEEGNLSDTVSRLLARALPRFHRLVTLITILDDGGAK